MSKIARSPALAGALVTLLGGAAVHAQDVLSPEDATRHALAHNAGLRAAQAEVAEREAGIAEARAGWFPRLSLAESWQRGDQPVFVFGGLLASRRFTAEHFAIDRLNHPDALTLYRTAVGLQQPLFDGRQRVDAERARLTRDVAALALDAARGTLAVATAETYGRIVAAEAARRAVDTAVQAARADRERAANRRDAGMATDADVLALDAHLAALVQRAVQADSDAAVARVHLNRLMGAPADRTYQVVEPGPAATAADAVDLHVLLAEAEAAHPALRQAEATARLARTESGLARAALLPRVTAQAGVEVNGMRLADRASSWLVGAEVSWNVSLGGAERARLTAASQARAKAAANVDDARAALHVDVVTALTERRSAAARVEAGRAAVAQARESERIVRNRFDAGMAGVTDLLRAQSAVLDAEAHRTTAVVDVMVSAARLMRALGRQP